MIKKFTVMVFALFASLSFADYTTYDELIKIVDSLLVLKPNLIVKKQYGVSPIGRELFAVKISDSVHVNRAVPEVSFDAATHSNELVALEMVVLLMRDLIREYDQDTLIKRLVDTREIWIYPMVVTDVRSRTIRGVNPNRDWGFYWSPDLGGDRPFQLVETRSAAKWVLENRFVISQTNHDGTNLFAWPWGFAEVKSADSTHYTFLANKYKAFSPYMLIGFYGGSNVGTGSMYLYGVMGSIGYTLEVNPIGSPPNRDSIVALRYPMHKLSMLEMINCADRGVSGSITDKHTGQAVAATIWIRQEGGGELRPSFSDPVVGDFHRFLAPGSYKIRVSANGYYESEDIDFEIGAINSSKKIDFELLPNPRYWGYRIIMNHNPGPSTLEKTNIQFMLGKPDNRNYSIGSGGYVVIDFGDTVRDISGSDFALYAAAVSKTEGYSVEIAQDWDGAWLFIGNGSGTTSFDINGKAEWFRYLRVMDDKDSDSLEERAGLDIDAVEFFKIPDNTAPSEIIGLTAEPLAYTSVKLKWQRSIDNESNIAAYIVLRNGVAVCQTRDTVFIDKNLTSGARYSYEVKAMNSRGLLSTPSSVEVNTTRDTTGAEIVYVCAVDSQTVGVRFNKRIDSISGLSSTNYTISGGVSILQANMDADESFIRLSTTNLPVETQITIAPKNILDRTIPQNFIRDGLAAEFSFLPNIAGYWRFNYLSEDTIYDESGNELHGVISEGALLFGEGVNKGLRLNGDNSFAVVKHSPSLKFGRRDFTVCCRVYIDTLILKMAILEKAFYVTGYRLIISDVDRTRIRFIRGTAISSGVQSNSGILAQSKWIHIGAVVKNDSVTLYADGEMCGKGPLAAYNADSETDLFIGVKGFEKSTSVPFRGMIDDIVIVDRALSDSSIKRLANSDLGYVSSPPSSFSIDQYRIVSVYPNPFNPSIFIELINRRDAVAGEIAIIDVEGRKIKTICSGRLGTGAHRLFWDGSNNSGLAVSSGVYFVRITGLESAGKVVYKKIIYSK